MPERYISWERGMEVAKSLDEMSGCKQIGGRINKDLPRGSWYLDNEPLIMDLDARLMGYGHEDEDIVHVWLAENHISILQQAGIVDFSEEPVKGVQTL